MLSVHEIIDDAFYYTNDKYRQPRENSNYKQQPQANRVSVTRTKEDIELNREVSDSGNDEADHQKSGQWPSSIRSILIIAHGYALQKRLLDRSGTPALRVLNNAVPA